MNQFHFKITGAATGDIMSEITVGESIAHLPAAMMKRSAKVGRVFIISDAAVDARYGNPLAQSLSKAGFSVGRAVVPSGERSKNIKQAARLYHQLARAGIERGSWIVALGGGMVGDLTGYVASTWLRGIPFIQVPTSLLAQVDASIGGKTAIDVPDGKNLVGSFYHPHIVWIDPSLLRSLPKAHIRNGLAEVIKVAAIRDATLFDTLEKKMETLLRGISDDWTPIIARCAEIKADVVQRDPKETKGLRALLNFGHSVGHAIESATDYAYLHGEAVSIGMFVAGFISQQVDMLEPIDRIRLGTLLTRAGLPARVKKPIPRDTLLQFMSRDKKVQDGSVRFVLLKGLGNAVSGQSVPEEVLDAALSFSGL